MRKHRLALRFSIPALMLGLLFSAASARASTIFLVSVDTSLLSGNSGFLDFMFNPGGSSQSAFAQVSSFSPGGSLSNSPTVTGDVTGTLPPLVTINNTTAFNDYFAGFTYGPSLSFLLTLGGPAVDAPNHTASSGSTFAFSMFANDGATPELTSSPDGFGFTVDVNLDGSTTVTDFITSENSIQVVTPEPAALALSLTGFAAIAIAGLRRRKK